MSLTNKKSLCVFETRPYEMINAMTGGKYQGYSCKAFGKDNTVTKFSTPNNVPAHDIGEYDTSIAVEFTLYGKEFHGEVKWSTVKPFPQPIVGPGKPQL